MTKPVLRRDHLHGRLQGPDLPHCVPQGLAGGHVDLVELSDPRPVILHGVQVDPADPVQAAEQVAAEQRAQLRVVKGHRPAKVTERRRHQLPPVLVGDGHERRPGGVGEM